MSLKLISIKEYSEKYNISVSTIRRRIKTNMIEYEKYGNKYMLSDTSQILKENNKTAKINIEEMLKFADKSISSITTLQNALSEEKDNRIKELETMNRQLQEEISELRMLVKILEEES